MPIISGAVAIGAGVTNANIIGGSPWEFLPFDAHVEIALSVPTGSANGDIVADAYSGSDFLGVGVGVPNVGAIQQDQHMYFEDDALAGERLVIKCRNTTAGAITVQATFELTRKAA